MLTRSELIAQATADQVPNEDIELLSSYLEEKQRDSYGTFWQVRYAVVTYLYGVLRKPITEMQYSDFRTVVNTLNTADYAKISKKSRWSSIRGYYEWAVDRIRENGGIINNMLPNRVKFDVTQHDAELQINTTQSSVITDEEFHKIETTARLTGYDRYIAFLLLKHCGMRVSELITIRVKNVFPRERYLITGIEYNARKNKKVLTFFYPQDVAAKLLAYIQTVESEWLFPSLKTPADHISRPTMNNTFGATHKFRKTLITRRIKGGCPAHVSELLVNHTISTVEFKHYVKLSVAERREYYDKYHPY